MAFTATRLVHTAAFVGNSKIRAAGQHMESWMIVTDSGTTSGTVTTFRITNPKAWIFFITDDGSVVVPTVVITPLGSGTSTLAISGLTSGKTYIMDVRGGV